jgi:gas vesicle protein
MAVINSKRLAPGFLIGGAVAFIFYLIAGWLGLKSDASGAAIGGIVGAVSVRLIQKQRY